MIEGITFSNEGLSLVLLIALVLNMVWVIELYIMKQAIKRALSEYHQEDYDEEG
tara:strand:+ start:1858 stop:2019 length:162 start_codon:yes stop_codon:yes gene_type:complete